MEPPFKFFILLVLIISVALSAFSTVGIENAGDHPSRRILHQPLFPTDPPAPPAQSFPTTPATPSQDTPFFPTKPPGPPTNPTQTPSISVPSNASEQGRVQSRSVKPAGKIFIAASVSIVAVIFVLALACFVHYRRARNSAESEKLIGREDAVRYDNEPSEPVLAPPPGTSAASHFLYVRTVEPSRGRSGEMKSSPYHRLRESHGRLDMHQPSPELQPLPPLTGPQHRSSPATTLLRLHHASPDLQPLPPLSGPPQQSPQAKKLSLRQGDRSPPSTMSSDEGESYHTAKDSAGNYVSPHRRALQQNFTHYATTNTSSTTRSSTSTNSSTNNSTSSDGGMEHTYAVPCRASAARRSPAESPNSQTRTRTAGSPPLQPMTVPLQSPPSEAGAPSPSRMTPNHSSSSSAVASLPFPPPKQRAAQKFQPPKAAAAVAAPPPPPPPPPTPPPPPPTSRPSPPLRPPRLSSIPIQPQHPISNKNKLPEPCPPPMAALVQDTAKPTGNKHSKDGVTEPVSTAPDIISGTESMDSSTISSTEAENDNLRPRLKPLHWDKVRASSDRAMVWDRLKSSSFKLDENMIETLFVSNPANVAPKEAVKKPITPAVPQENRVLDSKKSQNIAILLRALNVTREEVCEALLEGNPEGLGSELLETIVKMAPTKEEELKLKQYSGDILKLGPAERFLKAILDIPFAFKRIDALLYRINFEAEVKYLRKSFETLEAACEELRSSRLFFKLLEAVLKAGNRMNVGTNRGDAEAFKLDTLLKLVDIKGTDGKTTLLHFVVQEIIRSEGQGICSNKEEQHPDFKCEIETKNMHPKTIEDNFKRQGLQVVSGLANELSNVKKAAGMDSDVLSSYVSKLAQGLGKIIFVLQLEDAQRSQGSDNGKFSESMKLFLNTAEAEIPQVKAEESVALSLVKEITEYFHGDAAKEEAHPFRIFMIVRDFLSILDQVCKEVGRMQERTIMSSTRSFRISVSNSLPSFPRFERRQGSSDDESLSP